MLVTERGMRVLCAAAGLFCKNRAKESDFMRTDRKDQPSWGHTRRDRSDDRDHISEPEVIRVKTSHHLGVQKKGPDFELNIEENMDLNVTEDEEKIRIESGSLALIITKEYWSMTYERNGEVITKSSGRDLAFMKTDWNGFAYDKGGADAYMRQELGLSVGELVYGMGERFTAFTKNGQSVDIWNEDGGTSTYQSYKNIPFYLTNRGYGVFVNHPEKVSFEVGTEQVSKVEFSVPGESMEYFLINGPTMKEVLERYTSLTGKPSLPPQWTFDSGCLLLYNQL